MPSPALEAAAGRLLRTESPEEIVEHLEGLAAAVAGTVGECITLCLAANTPKDTGFAAASWIPMPGTNHDAVAGSKKAVNAELQQGGIARMRTYRLDEGKIYIPNNVPYILLLNSGTSSQAPSDFVDRSIDEGLRKAAEEIAGALRG